MQSNRLAHLVVQYMTEHSPRFASMLQDDVPLQRDVQQIIATDIFDGAMGGDVEKHLKTPLLPQPGETTAISLEVPKTSALFFDRIWACPGLLNGPTAEIAFWGGTEKEIWTNVVSSMLEVDKNQHRIEEFFGKELWGPSETSGPRTIADVLLNQHGVRSITVYASLPSYESEYHAGNMQTVIAAINDLQIVDEAKLEWAQVTEFRRDADTKKKLRRMRSWLDLGFEGKSALHVADELAIRLDDYEWALRKHGIQTVVGSLSGILDAKFLSGMTAATAGLALAGGEFWAAVGSTAILAGKAALSLTSAFIELKDKIRAQNPEIAFIHALKKNFG